MAEQKKKQCKGGVCDTPPEAFNQFRQPDKSALQSILDAADAAALEAGHELPEKEPDTTDRA